MQLLFTREIDIIVKLKISKHKHSNTMAYDLQSESDVKEYIEKLGIEYRFGCYSEKKPDVCHLLGDYLEGIKKDFEKASKVYRSNCDDYGYGKSCLKFGHYSFLGKGKATTSDKGDPKQAYQYYDKGCELRERDACLHSGLILISKTIPSVERDVLKGVDMLTKSCEMDNGTACFYLSGMYISGVQKKDEKAAAAPQKHPVKPSTNPDDYLLAKDMKKAFDYGIKACDLQNMYACANIAQMYQRGDGVAKDDKKAEFFKKKALVMQDEVRKVQTELKFQQGLE